MRRSPPSSTVLAATGAEQVDLVGHSQGGLLARQYLKFNGGAAKTDHVVTLGATNHGTTMSGIGNLDRFIGQLGLNLTPSWITSSARPASSRSTACRC